MARHDYNLGSLSALAISHQSSESTQNSPSTQGDLADWSLAMVTKIIFISLAQSLDTVPKPYYFESRNPHVSAVFTTALLDLASVRSTRATAANHWQLIGACRRDELVVANSNATSEGTG